MKKEQLIQLIKAAHVSEKSTFIAEHFNQYVFKVIKSATKPQIKKAVEMLFNVKVEAVQVCNLKSKLKRSGKIMGHRAAWKKAYVKLATGSKIDFSGLVA